MERWGPAGLGAKLKMRSAHSVGDDGVDQKEQMLDLNGIKPSPFATRGQGPPG